MTYIKPFCGSSNHAGLGRLGNPIGITIKLDPEDRFSHNEAHTQHDLVDWAI